MSALHRYLSVVQTPPGGAETINNPTGPSTTPLMETKTKSPNVLVSSSSLSASSSSSSSSSSYTSSSGAEDIFVIAASRKPNRPRSRSVGKPTSLDLVQDIYERFGFRKEELHLETTEAHLQERYKAAAALAATSNSNDSTDGGSGSCYPRSASMGRGKNPLSNVWPPPSPAAGGGGGGGAAAVIHNQNSTTMNQPATPEKSPRRPTPTCVTNILADTRAVTRRTARYYPENTTTKPKRYYSDEMTENIQSYARNITLPKSPASAKRSNTATAGAPSSIFIQSPQHHNGGTKKKKPATTKNSQTQENNPAHDTGGSVSSGGSSSTTTKGTKNTNRDSSTRSKGRKEDATTIPSVRERINALTGVTKPFRGFLRTTTTSTTTTSSSSSSSPSTKVPPKVDIYEDIRRPQDDLSTSHVGSEDSSTVSDLCMGPPPPVATTSTSTAAATTSTSSDLQQRRITTPNRRDESWISKLVSEEEGDEAIIGGGGGGGLHQSGPHHLDTFSFESYDGKGGGGSGSTPSRKKLVLSPRALDRMLEDRIQQRMMEMERKVEKQMKQLEEKLEESIEWKIVSLGDKMDKIGTMIATMMDKERKRPG